MRLSRREVLIGVVIAAMASGGYAIADTGGQTTGGQTAGATGTTGPSGNGSGSDITPPDWRVEDIKNSSPEELRWREEAGAIDTSRLPQQGEDNLSTEGIPPDWIVDQCRYGNAPQGGPEPGSIECEGIIAIAEGRIPPGTYTDAQLQQELQK